MSDALPVSEGFVQWDIPGIDEPCQTWYKVIGALDGPRRPLMIAHGGPGGCHEYLLPLTDIYRAHGIPLVLYDQIGNGRSTHFLEKAGDTCFWTIQLFLKEIGAVLRHLRLHEYGFDLLGHSCGGMIASTFAAQRPKGLGKLILADSPASAELMMQGIGKLRTFLPHDVQDIISRSEISGNFDTEGFREARTLFSKKHFYRLDGCSEEVNALTEHLRTNSTVASTMWGPSVFTLTGSLRSWTVIEDIRNIEASTLLVNGRFDEMVDAAIQPFFDRLSKVKWVTMDQSSHMPHLEERQKFMELLGHFLTSED